MIIRVGLLAIVLAGCGLPAGTPGATGGSPPASAAPDASPTGSPSSRVESASPALPGDVPAGFPVLESMQAVAPDAGRFAAWSSDALPPEVYRYYLDALPAAGFKIDAAMPGGEAAIIRFTAPGGTAYQLDLSGSGPVLVSLGPPHD